ncbi:hypothetical protein GmRootV35_61480 [Variovorax sp. V35]
MQTITTRNMAKPNEGRKDAHSLGPSPVPRMKVAHSTQSKTIEQNDANAAPVRNLLRAGPMRTMLSLTLCSTADRAPSEGGFNEVTLLSVQVGMERGKF